MLLLKQYRPIDRRRFKDTLQKVYGARGTHALPENLVSPPSEWLPLFDSLAIECGLPQSMQEAYLELREFFQNHVLEISKVIPNNPKKRKDHLSK